MIPGVCFGQFTHTDIPWLAGNANAVVAACTTNIANWASQVVANGGAAPSQATKNALNTFECGLVANGLDTNIITYLPVVPDNLTAALTPVRRSPTGAGLFGNALFVNHNFGSGQLSTAGLASTTSGAGDYLETGVNTSNLTFTVSGGAYHNAIGVVWLIGGNNFNQEITGYNDNVSTIRTANSRFDIVPVNASSGCATTNWTTFYVDVNRQAWTFACSAFTAGGGYFMTWRTNATYRGVTAGNSTTPHAIVGNFTDTEVDVELPWLLLIFAAQSGNNGGPIGSDFCTGTLSFWFVGQNMSSGKSASLMSLIQTLRNSLGGGFP